MSAPAGGIRPLIPLPKVIRAATGSSSYTQSIRPKSDSRSHLVQDVNTPSSRFWSRLCENRLPIDVSVRRRPVRHVRFRSVQ